MKVNDRNVNCLLAVEEYRDSDDEGEQGEAVADEINRRRDDFHAALDRGLTNVAA